MADKDDTREARDQQAQRETRDQRRAVDRDEEEPTYKVAAPYVTLRWQDAQGNQILTGFYAGAVVPATANDADIEKLLSKDMLVRIDDPIADIVAVPAGTPMPGEPPNVPVEEVPRTTHDERMARARELVGTGPKGGRQQRRGDDSGDRAERGATPDGPGVSGQQTVTGPQQPAQNAAKAEWVEYAVGQGEDRVKAEAMSKEQLVGKHGKR